MANEVSDNRLREMARHRGLKLLKSRRRKPGAGDFGKYGLTDDKGKPLLGVGENGLTATAGDIENYLRTGTTRSWQQSTKVTPPKRPAPNVLSREDEVSIPSPVRASARQTPPARPVKPRARTAAPRPTATAVPAKVTPKHEAKEELQAPRLIIRLAKPGDASALAKLLGQLGEIKTTGSAVTENLAASRKSGGGVAVAERGDLVGCCSWIIVPTLHRGPVGRITALIVTEGYRRQGIGTQLLATAQEALRKKGCIVLEVMSDIEIENSHNFFRTLKFEQASYRFTRNLEARRAQ